MFEAGLPTELEIIEPIRIIKFAVFSVKPSPLKVSR